MTQTRTVLRSWDGLLLLLLLAVVACNALYSPAYLSMGNQINLFQLSIEKIMLAPIMALIIINGEIDLSVASVMGMAACVLAYLFNAGVAFPLAISAALVAGGLAGLVNGVCVAYLGLPSLAVTLAGLIGYRGIARIMLEDTAIGNFPAWFNDLGQRAWIGVVPFALVAFGVIFLIATVVLHGAGFGRYVYVIGNSADVARYSGVRVARVKLALFVASGLLAALAGVLLAARFGSVRGNLADGFELDIITMVLLGGVSIFGGSGTLAGVGLAVLLILNLRNGMGLLNISGTIQTGVIGLLLIGSVLVPSLVGRVWKGGRAFDKVTR